MSLMVTPFFDPGTSSYTYVVVEPCSRTCAVIDPVLDYDPVSGTTSTVRADEIVSFDTGTWQVIGTMPVGETTSVGYIFSEGEMSMSDSGQYLFLSTTSGVRGRPNVLPRARARSKPAFTRSRITRLCSWAASYRRNWPERSPSLRRVTVPCSTATVRGQSFSCACTEPVPSTRITIQMNAWRVPFMSFPPCRVSAAGSL